MLNGDRKRTIMENDIRTELYLDLLKRVNPTDVASEIREATWSATIGTARQGGFISLSQDDLWRFGAHPRYLLSTSAAQSLQTEVEDTLNNVLGIMLPEAHESDRLEEIKTLPKTIRDHCNKNSEFEAEIKILSDKIFELIQEANEVHDDLQYNLGHVISTLPPVLEKTRTATNDLTATTIETSLIKLSLIRAQTQRALYDQKSSKNPHNPDNLARAVVNAFKKLKEDEGELVREDRALANELREYEDLLKLVDGGSGGFRQVVEDWTRVKRETEECRKDLRRLGWTGD